MTALLPPRVEISMSEARFGSWRSRRSTPRPEKPSTGLTTAVTWSARNERMVRGAAVVRVRGGLAGASGGFRRHEAGRHVVPPAVFGPGGGEPVAGPGPPVVAGRP